MQKHPINKVRVYFDTGMEVEFPCSGTLSVSENARKAGGYRNAQEWTEYHITWVVYKEKEQPRQDTPVEEVEVVLGISADDYLDDPLFMGIEHGVPKFRKPQDLIDFGLDGVWNDTGL